MRVLRVIYITYARTRAPTPGPARDRYARHRKRALQSGSGFRAVPPAAAPPPPPPPADDHQHHHQQQQQHLEKDSH